MDLGDAKDFLDAAPRLRRLVVRSVLGLLAAVYIVSPAAGERAAQAVTRIAVRASCQQLLKLTRAMGLPATAADTRTRGPAADPCRY